MQVLNLNAFLDRIDEKGRFKGQWKAIPDPNDKQEESTKENFKKPHPRSYHASFVFKDKMYIHGGEADGCSTIETEFEKIDFNPVCKIRIFMSISFYLFKHIYDFYPFIQ